MIKAVIFDMGGVLSYDVWEHMFLDVPNGLAASFGLNYQRVYQAAKTLWDQFAYRGTSNPDGWIELEYEYWQNFIQLFDLSYSPEYFIDLTDQFIRPVPGMHELLAQLEGQGLELLLCSNNNEFFFHRQMTKLDLFKFFPDPVKIVLSSRCGVPKSDPSLKMFHMVLEAVRCQPRECLFIDDRVENIERAIATDLPVILFPSESNVGAAYLKLILQQLNCYDRSR